MIHITDENINFETAIVLGNFDGIHIGHRELIRTASEYASGHGLALAAFSFVPHPVSVLSNPDFRLILTSEEKAFLFADIGVDYLIECKFDLKFAATTPYDFIFDILLNKYNCRALFVGESFRFGKNHTGDSAMLKEIALSAGIEAIIIPEIYTDSGKVSSSGIRKLITENNLRQAAQLLGCPFFMIGEVVHGNKLGRTIGFPTANLLVPKTKLLPRNGVYLTQTHLDGNILSSITNIGVRPTVTDKADRIAETFIFGFDASIYNKIIRVDFLDWIRDEVTFGSIDELKKQIKIDEGIAKELLIDPVT